jgi:Flp pilus assembly protein TadG
MSARTRHPLSPMCRRLARRWHAAGEAGSVPIEFGFAFPVLFLLMYGIIELSHYGYVSIAVEDAARDGSRYAMVRGATSPQPAATSDVVTFVKGRMALVQGSYATVTVNFSPDDQPGSVAQVTVSYPYQPFIFGPLTATNVTSTSKMTFSQ